MTWCGGARHGAAAATGLALPGRGPSRRCAPRLTPTLFPGKGQHALAKTAMRICWQCPVRVPCLDYALSGADTWGRIATGIWGGTTPQERDRLRQQRKAVAA